MMAIELIKSERVIEAPTTCSSTAAWVVRQICAAWARPAALTSNQCRWGCCSASERKALAGRFVMFLTGPFHPPVACAYPGIFSLRPAWAH